MAQQVTRPFLQLKTASDSTRSMPTTKNYTGAASNPRFQRYLHGEEDGRSKMVSLCSPGWLEHSPQKDFCQLSLACAKRQCMTQIFEVVDGMDSTVVNYALAVTIWTHLKLTTVMLFQSSVTTVAAVTTMLMTGTVLRSLTLKVMMGHADTIGKNFSPCSIASFFTRSKMYKSVTQKGLSWLFVSVFVVFPWLQPKML